MSNSSNLYAEKIYSEHPLVLWALDDQLDYISLISEAQRDIYTNWTSTNALKFTGSSITGEPFPESTSSKIRCFVPIGGPGSSTIISPNIINFQDMNSELETFCISSNIFSNTPYLSSISIGYEYTDPTTSSIVQVLKNFDTTYINSWAFFSETFDVPNINAQCRVVIKFFVIEGGASSLDYEFYVNGTTFGQWSEEFNVTSLGVTPQAFTENVALNGIDYVVPASAYGISQDSGYYILNDNKLLAKNTSIPMVYGASGITKLIPNINNNPSLIIPGKGFLNNVGKYRDYTVEFWARINSDTYTQRKIFGPISSSDGLYIESGFLTLNINGYSGSHFVGQWFRPMIIQIKLVRGVASVLLNGEQVISFIVDQDSLVFPNEFDNNNDSQDWLGFYCYSDVDIIEVDCVAIYSYDVPITVAKRRMVYGQGVVSPEGINSAYGGTSAFIDYSFANYAVNYSYPNLARWDQGKFDNLVTTSDSLTVPTYALPQIYLSNESESLWYSDCELVQGAGNKFVTFRPSAYWDDIDCYMYFEKFDFLSSNIKSFYGVFQVSDSEANEQILFFIYNSLTRDTFKIVRQGSSIKYYINLDNVNEQIIGTDLYIDLGLPDTLIFETHIDSGLPSSINIEEFDAGVVSGYDSGNPFVVGINIDKLSLEYGSKVSQFFGDRQNLKMYIGGNSSGNNTFSGNILSIGLSTGIDLDKIRTGFDNNGIAIVDEDVQFLSHTASYTLTPTLVYDSLSIDIGVSGAWEDYLPLSYFGKYVKNSVGQDVYSLNFLQLNFDYPEPSYAVGEEYDTSNSEVRAYITLQYATDGANKTQDNFTTTVLPNKNGVIDLKNYPNWETTKFEIIDNTLFYPPNDVDFNSLAMVYRFEFNVTGTLRKPVKIRNLEIASQVLQQNSFNRISTRFGVDVYPYKRSGIYYDYLSDNPISIYKNSTPYLYLNKNSGIEVRGDYSQMVNRGISIPINSNLSQTFKISAMQMWLMYDHDYFINTHTEVFDISYLGDVISFYIVSNDSSGKRGRIFARKRSDGSEFNGLVYYINGKVVRDPVISIKEWNSLGIGFLNSLNFNSHIGSINLTGPFVFNNISYYQANDLQQIQSNVTRAWQGVLVDGVTTYDWQYWNDSFIWEEVLIIGQSEQYGVNPSDVYQTYLGTNKVIFDDSDGISIDAEQILVYTGIDWQSSIKIPT
jgi:hypothetical protein